MILVFDHTYRRGIGGCSPNTTADCTKWRFSVMEDLADIFITMILTNTISSCLIASEVPRNLQVLVAPTRHRLRGQIRSQVR